MLLFKIYIFEEGGHYLIQFEEEKARGDFLGLASYMSLVKNNGVEGYMLMGVEGFKFKEVSKFFSKNAHFPLQFKEHFEGVGYALTPPPSS